MSESDKSEPDKLRINFAGSDSYVEAWPDGEWMIVRTRSGGIETTISLNAGQACRLAWKLTPDAGKRFDEARAARHALYELNYPGARADQLRRIAKEIDCGMGAGDCAHAFEETCPERRFCGGREAEELRSLADALDLKASLAAVIDDPPEATR